LTVGATLDMLPRRAVAPGSHVTCSGCGRDLPTGARQCPSCVAPSRATILLDEVERLLRLRDKIGAITVYRRATGVQLKDAKDTIDAIEKAMNLEPRGHSMLGAILAKIWGDKTRGWRGEAG
jgi:hypothetical protein